MWHRAAPPPPLVTVDSVRTVTKKHLITEILVGFSGAVNASEAQTTSTYELIMANSAGLFVPTKKTLLKIKSASYANDAVTLKLKTPLKLKKSVELIVDGVAPNGLQDSYGRLIDGADNGQVGEQRGFGDLEVWREDRRRTGRPDGGQGSGGAAEEVRTFLVPTLCVGTVLSHALRAGTQVTQSVTPRCTHAEREYKESAWTSSFPRSAWGRFSRTLCVPALK